MSKMSESHAVSVQIENELDDVPTDLKITVLCAAMALIEMGDDIAAPPSSVYAAIEQAKGLVLPN